MNDDPKEKKWSEVKKVLLGAGCLSKIPRSALQDVIDLEDYRKVWTNTTVDCMLCKKTWVGTHHKDTFALECYNCASMNPIRKADGYGEIFASLAWAVERLFNRIARQLRSER